MNVEGLGYTFKRQDWVKRFARVLGSECWCRRSEYIKYIDLVYHIAFQRNPFPTNTILKA